MSWQWPFGYNERLTAKKVRPVQYPMRHRMRANVGGACALVQSGGQFDSLDSCNASSVCGWKFKCNPDLSCTLASSGTYDDSATCFANCQMKYMCNTTTYTCVATVDGTYADATTCAQNCVDPTTVRVAAGSATILKGASPGTFTSGSEYLVAIGNPFTAVKPFVQVRCDSTGTVYLAATNSDGSTGSGSDNANARYELRAYGNVTANQPDPDSSYPVIVWGDDVWGGRNAADVGKIPGFTGTSMSTGNGRAVVNKMYRMYIRVWDQTDDSDIKLTWPTVTITQSDNGGYTMTSVPNSVLGNYPSTITSSDKTPCLNYYYNKATAPAYKVAFNPELGIMYSPSRNYKLVKDDATGALRIFNMTTNSYSGTNVPLGANSALIALCMQTDGNLVDYDVDYAAIAATNTLGTAGPYTLSLSDTGVLAVKDNTNTVKWSYSYTTPVETGFTYDVY